MLKHNVPLHAGHVCLAGPFRPRGGLNQVQLKISGPKCIWQSWLQQLLSSCPVSPSLVAIAISSLIYSRHLLTWLGQSCAGGQASASATAIAKQVSTAVATAITNVLAAVAPNGQGTAQTQSSGGASG